MKEIIIYVDDKKNKNISLLEEGKIIENYQECSEKEKIEGNIYIGKVQKVLPGMQAAFVDIGKGKNAFLHIKDILPKESNETGNKNRNFEKLNVKDYIRVGMPIMVQVHKDECGSKGAKVSTHIKLSGRFIVLIPNVNFITASSKIEDKNEIERLKLIVKSKKKENMGIIIRTSAQGQSEIAIQKDIINLICMWENIVNKFRKIKQEQGLIPCLIYKNYNIIEKILLDLMDKDIEKVTLNDRQLHNDVINFLNENNKTSISIEIKDNVLSMYNIQKQMEKMQERKIWLKCRWFYYNRQNRSTNSNRY